MTWFSMTTLAALLGFILGVAASYALWTAWRWLIALGNALEIIEDLPRD